MSGSSVLASDPAAQEAAEQMLSDGGSAVDAVIAAFFGAAGERDDVAFAPLVAVVGGVGRGARWFDGRGCQPGRGMKRPRGFRAEDAIPRAASAAVPRSLAALALLQSYAATKPPSALLKAGLAQAKRAGAAGRRGLLQAFVARGAACLASREAAPALLAATAPTEGGVWSQEDLEGARPAEHGLTCVAIGAGLELATPPDASEAPRRRPRVVVAADLRGQVAAVAYTPDPDGLTVEGLELRLALDAEPVRRGVPRVTPGTILRAPSPIGIVQRPSDAWYAAIGLTGGATLPAPEDASSPLPAQLDAWTEHGRPALAAITQRRKTQSLRSD